MEDVTCRDIKEVWRGGSGGEEGEGGVGGKMEGDVSRHYSSLYTSPIFEVQKRSRPLEGLGRSRTFGGRICRTPSHEKLGSPGKDTELRKLKSEIQKLRVQIDGKDMRLPQSLTQREAWKCDSIKKEELEGLIFLLDTTRRKCEEEIARNEFLEERLQNQARQHEKLLEEHAWKLRRTEKALCQAQELNTMLTNGLLNSEATLTDLLSHYKGIVVSLENRINDAQINMNNLRELTDRLSKDLVVCRQKSNMSKQEEEEEEEKEKVLRQELTRQEMETDNKAISMVQDSTHFLHENENKIAYLEMKASKLKQDLQDAASSSSTIATMTSMQMQEELAVLQRDIMTFKLEEEAFKSRYNMILLKLSNARVGLRRREEALEKLAKQAVAIRKGGGDDEISVLERVEWPHMSLRSRSSKEAAMATAMSTRAKRNPSKRIIAEMEIKLASMEEEFLKARQDMESLKDQNVALRQSTTWNSM